MAQIASLAKQRGDVVSAPADFCGTVNTLKCVRLYRPRGRGRQCLSTNCGAMQFIAAGQQQKFVGRRRIRDAVEDEDQDELEQSVVRARVTLVPLQVSLQHHNPLEADRTTSAGRLREHTGVEIATWSLARWTVEEQTGICRRVIR